MSPEDRADVVASLPSEIERATPPEGDLHWTPKASAIQTLREHFRRIRRGVYFAAEMAVYYPDERMFAPDLIAVCDVALHPRMSWIVSQEGRGLDLALEIHVSGDWSKDFKDNVERFPQLRIPEYFAFDVPRCQLAGWRLPGPDARRYEEIVAHGGRLASEILGLDLGVEGDRLRFFHLGAPVLEPQELVDQLRRKLRGLGVDPDVA